ncbi:MAG: CIA30 family protein [Verrucomicrobia bacterium]|nr:CIA30 family protein [Verrucomicrobiota bacterium]
MKTSSPSFALRLLIPTACTLLLAVNTTAAEKTIFDFQTATNTAAWQIVNDDFMGGVSRSEFRLTKGMAVFRGELSLENNGGFASVRSLPTDHDLAGCDAFVIRVRGDGRSYKFTVRTDRSLDSAVYQTLFTTKRGEWEELRLPLKQFVLTSRGRVLSGASPIDPAKVTSVGFLISGKQAGPFQLGVAWIKATGSATKL